MSSKSLQAQIGMLILATSIVQLANGFFGTFFSLRVAIENFQPALSGLVLSSYFAGFTLGALRCEGIIERVGHIRAYAAFAGMVGGATAAMPLLVGPLSWLILRAVIGFGCSGLFIATESWLNAKAEPSQRGWVFSIYMFGTFVALALGQLLIGQAKVETGEPFNAIAVLFAVALVMVSTTRAEPPRPTASTSLSFGQLFRSAPIAFTGCMASGLVSASFYSLVPAWMQNEAISRETIATFMLFAVLGGLAFQVPIGRLSDRFDRHIVLSILSFGLAASAIALVTLPHTRPIILSAAVLLGGFMSTLYPVCVANAHDQLPADQVVAVSGRLILVSGLGSILGPLIGTGLKTRLSIDGVFYLIAAIGLLLGLLAVTRRLVAASPAQQERTFEILAPQATPLAHDLLGPPIQVSTPQAPE
jgi:MFS family permease